MEGMKAPKDIEMALGRSITILKLKMFAAADAMRAMYKYKTTIVLTGARGIDTEGALKRLVDSVRALDALKAPSGTA
jgi:hypothetical protein